MINQIRDLGPKAGAAAAALVKASDDELKKLVDAGAAAAFQTGQAMTDAFTKADPLIAAAGGKISQSAINAFTTKLTNANNQGEIDSAIAAFQKLLASKGIKIPMAAEITAFTISKPAVNNLTRLQNSVPFTGNWLKNMTNLYNPKSNPEYFDAPRKNGGFIGKLAMGFASGGLVSGPGGPRSDRIPIMLSNGEFVVNAASTEKNLSLLRAINGDSNAANGVGNTITVNVHPSPGMDEQALAAVVSRQLAFEMRRGGF